MTLPTTTSHPRFGTLKLENLIGCYEGNITLPGGKTVTLFVAAHGDEPLPELLDLSATTLDTAIGLIDEASRYAAAELTSIHNDAWTDGNPAISEAQFSKRIKLEAIHVSSGGIIDYTYDDDDLFWGHSVRVEYLPKEGFFNALFEG